MSGKITLTTFAVAGTAASFATAAKSIELGDGEMLPVRLDAWAAGAVAVRASVPPGTVTIDPALVERVRIARDGADEMMVNRWLADAVLTQLGGGR